LIVWLILWKVYENEEKWVNYDEEETEVGVEVADMVFEKLVTDAVKDLIKLLGNPLKKWISFIIIIC